MRIFCPTPMFKIRSDSWGNGNFGAPRGTRPDGSKKYHDGIDLEVTPGDQIVSMIDGEVEKVDYPYRSDFRWRGIQIANKLLRVEIWYMEPMGELIGETVEAGQLVGVAQNISLKYDEQMKPHVHLRTTMRSFTALSSGQYITSEIICDPTLFLGG